MNREKRIESMESSLENVSKMERFREHCGKAKVMFVASVLLFVEIILLNCLIGKSLTGFLLPNWALGTCVFVIESALWVIILINFIASVSVIIRSTWNRAGCRASIFRHGRADSCNLKERELEYQMNLERSKKFEQKSHYFDVPHIIGLDWIGAIRSVPSRHAQLSSVSPDLSSVEESPYSLRDHLISSSPTGTKHSKSYITPRGDDPDLVLETKVGARVSPYNRAITSVQTSKQLDELLEANSFLDISSASGPAGAHISSQLSASSTTYHSLSKSAVGTRQLHPSFLLDSPCYEPGTSFIDDDQGKSTADENGVLSLISGNRVTVTESRVSLSPIPCNLLNAGSDLSSYDGASSGKETTNGILDSFHDSSPGDNTSFRVAHQAVNQSPVQKDSFSSSSSFHRSESFERRRSSLCYSPRKTSPFRVSLHHSASPETSSGSYSRGTSVTKQIHLSSLELTEQYKLNTERLAAAEKLLRAWICNTIIRPLVEKADEINAFLSKKYSQLHLSIGKSSPEALQLAVSTKSDLLCTALPYIIPFLKVHERQTYIMRRARELSSDICMKEFKWQSGGEDTVEQDGQDTRSYSPPFAVWNEHLPTDTQLVWSWFCVYMDNRMSVNSLASDLNAPFTSVYFLKKPNKPTTIQNAKDSFYLFESSVNPPHFEFVVNGGRERFDVGRGPKNFWRALLLFIQHIRLFCNKHIDHLSIDETGINLSCVLD